MPDAVTNDMLYEVLKSIQQRVHQLAEDMGGSRHALLPSIRALAWCIPIWRILKLRRTNVFNLA